MAPKRRKLSGGRASQKGSKRLGFGMKSRLQGGNHSLGVYKMPALGTDEFSIR